jgi:hypothetical protein
MDGLIVAGALLYEVKQEFHRGRSENMHTATRPARTSGGHRITSRFSERRQDARARRQLELALGGYYGRGVQSDVMAAKNRQV